MADVKISDLPAAGAITGAEIVPVDQGGSTVKTTVNAMKNGAVKVYRALLSQSGSSVPTATVLENTLGGIPALAIVGTGHYTLTLAGAFPANKTFCQWQGDYFNGATFWPQIGRENDNVIHIYSYEGDAYDPLTKIQPVNLGVSSGALEILVYP
jgi:hypothetical protein